MRKKGNKNVKEHQKIKNMLSGGNKLIEKLKDKFGEVSLKDRHLENNR